MEKAEQMYRKHSFTLRDSWKKLIQRIFILFFPESGHDALRKLVTQK